MSIAVVGEALIDFLPDAKGNYTPHLGGSPYNIAIGLARQNRSVSYLTPLSDDSFGDTLYSSLRGRKRTSLDGPTFAAAHLYRTGNNQARWSKRI
jgi:sugar/nucleoside kinase (ribokinase family)